MTDATHTPDAVPGTRRPIEQEPRRVRIAIYLEHAAALVREAERAALGGLTYPGDGAHVSVKEHSHLVAATPLIAAARGQVEAALEIAKSAVACG